jgi:outer membrane beta-barrel protein
VEGNTLQVTRDDADSNRNHSHQAPARELRLAQTAKPQAADPQRDPWTTRIRVALVVFAVLWLFLVGAMWSRAASAADTNGSNSEYSFKWLDPDKKIYVLQNRRYLKADHVMISGMLGPGFSNPYRSTFSFQPRAAYYFSEDWGFEVFYSKVANSQNNTYKALVSTNTSVFPVIREIRSEFGALAQWVPWYAKINVFNSILYFDWYFAGGLGSVNTAVTTGTDKASLSNYVTQTETAFYLATGHQYHINETFTVRLDFMGTYYRAPLTGQTGDSVWFSNYDFTFGLGVRL